MNCKPDDLAMFVRSAAGNEGRIVRCLRIATSKEMDAANWSREYVPVWLLDRSVPSVTGRTLPYAPDAFLRPIRDPGDDATDETLIWKPVPQEVTQ